MTFFSIYVSLGYFFPMIKSKKSVLSVVWPHLMKNNMLLQVKTFKQVLSMFFTLNERRAEATWNLLGGREQKNRCVSVINSTKSLEQIYLIHYMLTRDAATLNVGVFTWYFYLPYTFDHAFQLSYYERRMWAGFESMLIFVASNSTLYISYCL